MIFKRLKNLWELSAYKVEKNTDFLDPSTKILRKDFPTIQKKPATIIQEPINFFEQEND